MIEKQKAIVCDIDGTLCPIKSTEEQYADLIPYPLMVEKLREYQSQGFRIILHSSRNMNTFDGNIGEIYANTGKILLTWLEQHNIPYDELVLGKPWQGTEGFYIDDNAIRPSEFRSLSCDEITQLLTKEHNANKNQ